MDINEARRIIVEQMKADGTYEETVDRLRKLVARAEATTAVIPGRGSTTAWELATDMAADGHHVAEISRALSRHFWTPTGDALQLAAHAMGRRHD